MGENEKIPARVEFSLVEVKVKQERIIGHHKEFKVAINAIRDRQDEERQMIHEEKHERERQIHELKEELNGLTNRVYFGMICASVVFICILLMWFLNKVTS